jgi:hypothetical protein
MAAVILRPKATRPRHVRAERVYLALTRRLARAAACGDETAVRRLLVRRERLLAELGRWRARVPRALRSEVRALEALTMVALGVDPIPAGDRLAR